MYVESSLESSPSGTYPPVGSLQESLLLKKKFAVEENVDVEKRKFEALQQQKRDRAKAIERKLLFVSERNLFRKTNENKNPFVSFMLYFTSFFHREFLAHSNIPLPSPQGPRETGEGKFGSCQAGCHSPACCSSKGQGDNNGRGAVHVHQAGYKDEAVP